MENFKLKDYLTSYISLRGTLTFMYFVILRQLEKMCVDCDKQEDCWKLTLYFKYLQLDKDDRCYHYNKKEQPK